MKIHKTLEGNRDDSILMQLQKLQVLLGFFFLQIKSGLQLNEHKRERSL